MSLYNWRLECPS